MKSTVRKSGVTRRGFFGTTARVLAATKALAAVDFAMASGTVPRKIALEEHFVIPDTLKASYGAAGSPEFQAQLLDLGEKRIAQMDRGGVDVCILSLVGPGIQAIPETSKAVELARRANDHLAQQIRKFPKRFRGFAALPMQDPQEATKELKRTVRELGFCGALVNGFSQASDANSEVFYDSPAYGEFWGTVQDLDVPFYLHPRSPLPGKQPAYQGNEWMTGSIWGFTVEASIHALRLMGSGLFDDFPKLNMILGHLGEGLPCSIWRIDNRIARTLGARPKAKMPMGHYLRENFYITTSGNFRTQTLSEVMLEVGADRILYSVDYPFEDMGAWRRNGSITPSFSMANGRRSGTETRRNCSGSSGRRPCVVR